VRRANALRGGRRSIWLAVTALLVLGGIVASVLGARAVASSETQKARLASHLASAEIAATLKLAILHEEDLVVSASAYVTGNPRASAADFDRWATSVKAMNRFRELQNIGLVKLVPASGLASFERYIAAHPVRPLGPRSKAPVEGFEVIPAGPRPFYCFAVAGLARSAATYIPAGADYCALAPQLMTARDSGEASYAPFVNGPTTTLGVSTPVYRGGVVPNSVAARRREFVGWLGELLQPKIVLARALEGRPHVGVRFHYSSGSSHVSFAIGDMPAGARTSTYDLHNGWVVQTFAAPVPSGVFSNWQAAGLLVGGTLLSLLFGAFVIVLGTGRRRALALVMEKTRELSHQALHDALTGLPNRALVLDRAEQLLARTARRPGSYAGALFIDIDGFKHVNDNLGHAAGDQLLRVVGERLQAAVRDDDTVGRLGGDEFVVLVESSEGEDTLNLLADRLTEILRQPVELKDGRKLFSVTVSIGVAMGRYDTPDALLRDADLALYSAKAAGKDRYALFDASMYAGAEDRLALESDLSMAIEAGQLFLVYQPVVEIATRRIVGVEALLRWRHPRRGVVLPEAFIPIAEESGLITPIGRWVLERACRQAGEWAAAGHPVNLAVNVSAQQLGRRGLFEDVRRALDVSGLDPSALTLEITETTLTGDAAAATEHLRALRRCGVKVAIDDFGTGYASLSQLQRMPVDILKIDQSFVAALADDDQGHGLLEAVVGVGRALSLTVIAEGVEHESQLNVLRGMGCELAQGFLLGEPSTAEQLLRSLAPSAPAPLASRAEAHAGRA
jgi:diguanylate cyclase (GGDEF)-like protein